MLFQLHPVPTSLFFPVQTSPFPSSFQVQLDLISLYLFNRFFNLLAPSTFSSTALAPTVRCAFVLVALFIIHPPVFLVIFSITILETTLWKHWFLRAVFVYLAKPPTIWHEEVLLQVDSAVATIIRIQVCWKRSDLCFCHLVLELIKSIFSIFLGNLGCMKSTGCYRIQVLLLLPTCVRASCIIKLFSIPFFQVRRLLPSWW